MKNNYENLKLKFDSLQSKSESQQAKYKRIQQKLVNDGFSNDPQLMQL